jgi:hypothetical protein
MVTKLKNIITHNNYRAKHLLYNVLNPFEISEICPLWFPFRPFLPGKFWSVQNMPLLTAPSCALIPRWLGVPPAKGQ